MEIDVKVKVLRPGAKAPAKESEYAAGYDIRACLSDINEVLTIEPGETKMIGTGFAMAMPNDVFGAVFPRSGLSTKKGLRLANCVGVVDPDYRGEVMIGLYNDSAYPQFITHGERIAQMVYLPRIDAIHVEAEKLPATKRGSGGFGSTGTK